MNKATSAGKQSTLFGLPPPTIKEGNEKKPSNRGKKRKSDAASAPGVDGEEDCVEVTSFRKQPKNIQSFFGGKPTSAGKKSVSATGNKKTRSASASDREESADGVASHGEREAVAEDGIEATQEQEPEQEAPPMDGDNTSNESIEAEVVTPVEMEEASPAKEASSLSKLAAFKFSASKPASTEAASVAEEEQEELAA